ncbi:hypothetical protein ACFU6I_07085 [Streptomyces sp. NPDC057486]|uniref:hypothetical protein n=1 Tax=Streptomyces sp. NPDC057486 TaxID=3346145 RepID=UPI003696BD2E
MASDPLAVGALAFIGTGLVTATGFRQWRRTRIRDARENFRTQRVEALRKVREALSDLEEEQRTSILGHPASVAAGSSRITQVNLLLLRNSPFLRPDEQEWAQSFAHHVMEIDTPVRQQYAKVSPM